jgi:hypothetical protein
MPAPAPHLTLAGADPNSHGDNMFDHPLFWLVIATLGLLLGFLFWNLASVRRNQKTGGRTSGIGGPNDPMA